jgi:NADPH-dependent curcumin reductase CurA
MSAQHNTRIVLASGPTGRPGAEHFRLEQVPIPQPGDGEVLIANRLLSIDPYMRGRMDAGRSYAAPVPLDGVMEGGTVAQVWCPGRRGSCRASGSSRMAAGRHTRSCRRPSSRADWTRMAHR